MFQLLSPKRVTVRHHCILYMCNLTKHERRRTQLSTFCGQLPEDSQQAPNILQDVIDLSSDSEDDEVIMHWPPGLQFLDDEDFILGNLHHNAAPAA